MPEEQSAGQGARSFLARADADPAGGLKAVVIFVVCALLSTVLWYPLGLPSEIIRTVLAQPTNICRGGFEAFFDVGTPKMYFCSAAVGVLTMAGPIAILIVAFIYRGAVMRVVRQLRGRVPKEAEFLVAPVAATLIFTLAWAGSHFSTATKVGLLPQTVFPGVIGLFTFAVARWGGDVQKRLAGFFDRRDKYPLKVRAAAAVAVPFVLSFLLTNETRVTATALKEQIVVSVGLISGFLALAPRSGDVLAGVTREVAGMRQRVAALRKRPS
jgi:hypothetical protein